MTGKAFIIFPGFPGAVGTLLDVTFNELAEHGPPESAWSSLEASVEEENVAAEQEGIYILRNMEDNLDNHQPILDTHTHDYVSTLTPKNKNEV